MAYDEDEIVGYFCFFPITQKIYDDVMYKGYFRDDDIKAEDILPMETARHIYLLSVALYKEYQDKGIADKMMEKNLQNDMGISCILIIGKKRDIRYT